MVNDQTQNMYAISEKKSQIPADQSLDQAIEGHSNAHQKFTKEFNEMKIKMIGMKDKFRLISDQIMELRNENQENLNGSKKNDFNEKLTNLQISILGQVEKIRKQLSTYAL